MIPVERLLLNWMGMPRKATCYLVREFISFVVENVAFKLAWV
jgi:hypothetical protein